MVGFIHFIHDNLSMLPCMSRNTIPLTADIANLLLCMCHIPSPWPIQIFVVSWLISSMWKTPDALTAWLLITSQMNKCGQFSSYQYAGYLYSKSAVIIYSVSHLRASHQTALMKTIILAHSTQEVKESVVLWKSNVTVLLGPISYISAMPKQCRPSLVFRSDLMWFCVCRWTQMSHQSPQSLIYSLRDEANAVHTCGRCETTFGYVTLVQQVNVQSLVKIMFRPNLENDDFKKWIEKNSLPQDRTQREVSPAWKTTHLKECCFVKSLSSVNRNVAKR